MRWIYVVRAAGLALLLEQIAEAVILGVSLAQHPGLVAAALGALGLPEPRRRDP